MARKTRMEDVAAASAWYFGVDPAQPASTRTRVEARRCAYVACAELGYSRAEISRYFDRDRTTVIHALRGESDPDDVAAVLANARARALADSDVLA